MKGQGRETKLNIKFLLLLAMVIVVFAMSAFGLEDYVNTKINEYNLKMSELEELEGWDLSLIMYDSAVDSGKIQLTEDIWNATEQETRVITVQLNYKNEDVKKTYNPGDLKFSIDNLGVVFPSVSYGSNIVSYATATTVSADKSTETDKKYEFSYEYDSIGKKYYFTNNNTIEINNNFEGTIQLAYEFESRYLYDGSNIEIKANLNDLVDFSNTLRFVFTSDEMVGTLEKSASKISGYDGLIENADQYIWVKYLLEFTSRNDTGVRGVISDYYFTENIPENAVLLDGNLNVIDKNENGEYSFSLVGPKATAYTTEDKYVYGKGEFYVGYPTEQYGEEIVESITTWRGKVNKAAKYCGEDTEEKEIAQTTLNVNLKDYVFSYGGSLFAIEKSTKSGFHNVKSYKKIISEKWGETIPFEMYADIAYIGKKYTARIGDDIVFITAEDGTIRRLTDDEYYFKNLVIEPARMYNINNNVLEYEKYNMQLFVRYENATEFVPYGDSFKNTQSAISFEFENTVKAWYIEIYDLEESLVKKNGNYISSKLYIQTDNDLAESGNIYNYNFVQVFNEDENGNMVLSNTTNLDSYPLEEIALYDQEMYGNYIQRGTAKNVTYGID